MMVDDSQVALSKWVKKSNCLRQMCLSDDRMGFERHSLQSVHFNIVIRASFLGLFFRPMDAFLRNEHM